MSLTPEAVLTHLATLGVGAMLVEVLRRLLGKPGPTGADAMLASAQADKAWAEAEATSSASYAGTIRLLSDRVTLLEQRDAAMTQLLSTYRVKVDELTAEVERWRRVEAADKARIAELEARVEELESRARGGGPSALDGEGGP